MRLFVAVDVPDDIRDAIESEIVGELRHVVAGARWTRPEGRHLTLKFLGNVAEDRVEEIGRTLGDVAVRDASFEARFAGIGGFPNVRRPRVLWIGVEEGSAELSELARAVESGFEPLGFEPEGRAFHGHLTLARFPSPRAIELPDIDVRLRRFPVAEVVLFRSHLHPKGARYEALRRFALGG